MPSRLPSDHELAATSGEASHDKARVRVLSFVEPRLTVSSVERIAQALRAEQNVDPVVLDCSALAQVDAAGLSALLELGRGSLGMRELSLAGLTRALTLTAVQAGLSERFTVYATSEAALHDLTSHEPT